MKKPERIFIVRRKCGEALESLLFTKATKAIDQYDTWCDVYGMFPDVEIDILIYKLVIQ